MNDLINKIIKFFVQPQLYLAIIYVIVAIIIFLIIKEIINKNKLKNKRQKTIQKLLINIIKYVIIVITIIACLDVIGINVTSFVAGLGIVGVVVGLALQDIMKDALSGTFIIIGDQFDIGDTVEINGFLGKVISLGIKTTYLEDSLGRIKIISNRNISEVINYSKNNNVAVIDIPILYEENEEKLQKIFKNIISRCQKEIEEVIGEVEVTGIESFNSNCVLYKLTAVVRPTIAKKVERQMRMITKEEFEKNKVLIVHSK